MPVPTDVPSLGLADPVSNLGIQRPHLKDYSASKKRPQVRAMTKLVSELCQIPAQPCDVVDVGGGRGDLAMAVAALVPGTNVSVVESFAPSVHHGRERASELDLAVDFQISSAASLTAVLEEQNRRPVVMALHACGGLTDVALEACAKLRLPFCICPCCYASQPMLRQRELAPREQLLQRLAESNSLQSESSQLAACAINALRLRHLDAVPKHSELTAQLPPSWTVRVYTFPQEWSSRNVILWGHPHEFGQRQKGNRPPTQRKARDQKS